MPKRAPWLVEVCTPSHSWIHQMVSGGWPGSIRSLKYFPKTKCLVSRSATVPTNMITKNTTPRPSVTGLENRTLSSLIPVVVVFKIICALHTERCIRNDIQTHLGNTPLTFDAVTINPIFNSFKCRFDLLKNHLFVVH